ncbi:MAG: aldolase/citrate lyase family protein [Candidatus Krumholzibacteria bacterium]|jgi:citrate lyase subunit beta/citryl-CoA lyase|nr:aldolase/citrate lyase family protein [Candidatus Krumholzibacteria bacterium]MDP6669005.1 aldolase/citrate lyase family protein [Candidatus Krumholzibacteria bacterium]MDP6797390.1 aldolase/citrate lyase family protein [Candidatus Krumholzibacteria bacterium]MDP7021095.1 aldolase/citrate lyase family protein [Candidatus Krumholzibacteria bacterium]
MSAKVAEAGVRGRKVRSDLWTKVEPAGSGGLEIELQSKVEIMYGDSIRRQLRKGLETLGIENAKLQVEDAGALPYCIDARLEAAARRALPDLDKRILPDEPKPRSESRRDRFRRSRLYLPGNSPKLFPNSGLHGADALILDLEDAVAPTEKDAARILVRNALLSLDFGEAERMVRINQGERGLDDLGEIIPCPVQLILIPKVESAEDVRIVDEKIREISAECGREESVWLMPIIESSAGVLASLEIARASGNIVALAIGLEDYTADIGVPRTEEGRESLWMRSQIINSCRTTGIQAIDTVYSDVANEEGLRESVREAKALGFDGKGCIHPRQIRVVHETFAPSKEELEKACRVVLAFEDAEAQGLGVVSLGSKMIDAPVVKRAQHTVDLAIAMNLLNEQWRREDPS